MEVERWTVNVWITFESGGGTVYHNAEKLMENGRIHYSVARSDGTMEKWSTSHIRELSKVEVIQLRLKGLL